MNNRIKKLQARKKRARAYQRLLDAQEGMSDRQAEAEAQRRWGPDGMAWHPIYTRPGEFRYCAVGRMRGGFREEWEVLGRGETFEKAFADADLRKTHQKVLRTQRRQRKAA